MEASGFRDGYERVIASQESEFTLRAIYTTAWTFESIANASEYYNQFVQGVKADYSTEERAIGDEAVYWEIIGDFVQMIIRKSNVVWEIDLYREGTFRWDPNIDWVAGRLVAKV